MQMQIICQNDSLDANLMLADCVKY